MNQSIIEHKANMYYVELREDYLLICQNCTFKKDGKSKASPYCKAFILAILEHWTNDKRGKGEGLYIFMSYSQWIKGMYGMFGRTVIIDSIEELMGEGLISREAYKMFGRDTFKYLLNTAEINRRMRALQERNPEETHPNLDPSISKHDPSTSKRVTSSKVNGSHSLVDTYPSTSNHNIESNRETTIESNIDSNKGSVPVAPTSETPAHEDTHPSFSNSSSQQKDKSQVNSSKKARWELLLDYWDSKYGPGPRSKWVENEAKDMIERMKPTPEQVDKVCAELKARKKPITFESMYNNWHLLKEVEEREKAQATPSTSSSIPGYTDYTHVKPTKPIRPMPRAERNATPPTQKESLS